MTGDTTLTLQHQGPLLEQKDRQGGVHSRIDTSCMRARGGGRDLCLHEMYLHQKS